MSQESENIQEDLNPDNIFSYDDQLFKEPIAQIKDFAFDTNTAAVFDNMVSRSVPFYGEMQRMTTEIAKDFAIPGTILYDLGCSTGTTLLAMHELVDLGVRFVGVDNSREMLEKANIKLESALTHRSFELLHADLHAPNMIHNASVVSMILTLQFIRPLHREAVIKNIYDGLNDNGCLILIEKITSSETMINRLFIDYYYDYKKRNNYSDIEISQKREALENVLIPYRPEENLQMLNKVGFRHIEEFFRWYNFSALIALK